MSNPKLEEVFKLSGVPTYNFVKSSEYPRLFISLRTPGRGLIVEGPSGIGKTTSVIKAIDELGLTGKVLQLSARKSADRDLIAELPLMKEVGTVIIDDFHRLDDMLKRQISDYLKTLADEEAPNSKLVLIGINQAGHSLVKFARDLNDRIDTIKFEVNPDIKVQELIKKGAVALNIKIPIMDDIVNDSRGSFHIAQLLCNHACLHSDVTERCEASRTVTTSIELVRAKVLEEQDRAFFDLARKFVTGTKLRASGRAPYLHILRWLASGPEFSINIEQTVRQYPEHKGSVSQVVEKGYLEKLISESPDIQNIIHYDASSKILSIEDPKFAYYIRNLSWNKFGHRVGFRRNRFKGKYDFALSFAGSCRPVAQAIYEKLTERELSVFYDFAEQHNILAEDVEQYLAPIYRSEAEYVVVLLNKDYPSRVWTKFESDQFRHRFGDKRVIPVRFNDTTIGFFDAAYGTGSLSFDLAKDAPEQIDSIVDCLQKKIAENNQVGDSEPEED